MTKESLESKVPVFYCCSFNQFMYCCLKTCYSGNITVNRILRKNKVGSACAFSFLRGHKAVNPFVVYWEQ